MTDLRRIDTFGKVAAEDDAILDYFLTTETVSRIEQGSHLLIIGNKGAGKTAIVRHFTERPNPPLISRAVRMTDYPWGVHALRVDAGAGETDAYTAAWEYLLAAEYAKIISRACEDESDDGLNRIRRFLKDNYGSEDASPSEMLRPDGLKVSGTLEPQLFGCKLFRVDLKRESGDTKLGAELHAVADALFANASAAARKYAPGKRVLLHIDELDHGLSTLDASRSNMLIGLILAARAVFRRFESSDTKFSPIVYLRTDLWEALQFSDKNKIRQTSTHEIRWTEEELKRLVEVRAATKLGVPAITFDGLEDGDRMRGSQRKWSHIVARTKLRPRDVIQFMNCVLGSVKSRLLGPWNIKNEDVTAARQAYSEYFKAELDDEILPHWREWEVPMGAIASNSKVRFGTEEFAAAYSRRDEGASDPMRPSEALRGLFSFSVIGYLQPRGGGGSRWVFRHLDPNAQWDPGATLFKVHPGLKEYYRLREERASADAAESEGESEAAVGSYDDDGEPFF